MMCWHNWKYFGENFRLCKKCGETQEFHYLGPSWDIISFTEWLNNMNTRNGWKREMQLEMAKINEEKSMALKWLNELG